MTMQPWNPSRIMDPRGWCPLHDPPEIAVASDLACELRDLIGGVLGDVVGVEDAPAVPHPAVQPELPDLDHVPRRQRQTVRSRVHTVWITEPAKRVRAHHVGVVAWAIGPSNAGWLVIPERVEQLTPRERKRRQAGRPRQHCGEQVRSNVGVDESARVDPRVPP